MNPRIEYTVGDLIEADEPVIAHGCNTKGLMGAGIAKLIREKHYRTVYGPYYEACLRGQFVPGTAQLCETADDKIVFNLATQDEPGPHADEWWVLLAFANMFEQCIAREIRKVAIPRIGCGIGGLKWDQVNRAISTAQHFRPKAPKVVVYTHPSEQYKTW